jgi:hypothetical protein
MHSAKLESVKQPKALTAKEARQFVLSASPPILRDLLAKATGLEDEARPGHYYNVDIKARSAVLDIITPMMQDAGDLQKLNAENMGEVLALLKEGIVTISEAKELMQILSTKAEMEEIKDLSEKLAELTDG